MLEGVVDGVDRLTLIDRAHTAADRPRAEADDRHEWSVVAELSLLHSCSFPVARYQLVVRERQVPSA